MTPEQHEIFTHAAAMGVACGLGHRYEWFVNADRALIHGPYSEMPERGHKLLEAFIAFEKLTASCPEEAAELDKLDSNTYMTMLNEWYAQARAANRSAKNMNRKDISDAFVKAVGDGIREFNKNSPPSIVRTIHGVVQPPTEREKAINDSRWYEAVRYGLYKAAEA